MKVYLETMGCQMNRLDGELVAGRLLAAGHELVEDPKSADVVLYNTCSVRRHAEQKAYSRLGAAGQRKAHHRPRLIIGVLGCMAQREGQDLLRRFPQLDIVCSPGRLAGLVEMIEAASGGRPAVALDPNRKEAARAADGDDRLDELDRLRDPGRTASPFQAYVRVMHGCDNFCSYCVVPFVRGPERSRRPDRIVDEVRRLVEAGRTEITLLGQTVNSYRYAGPSTALRAGPSASPGAGGATVRFSDLLARVAAVAGLRRLRFITSYPLDFGDDILAAMRDLPNVCPYIHLPAQSGSDAVLKRMNRGYTRARYDELIDRARATVPGVVLAGDFIVGFPGETEDDHAASADLIRRTGYKNCFIFKYSPRPGTFAAERLADDVPAAVKRRRNNELLAVQEEVGLAHHAACVGQTVEVLAEGPSVRAGKQSQAPRPDATQLVGRTVGDHIVHFTGPLDLAGQYIRVRITGATPLALLGEATHQEQGAPPA